VLHSLDTKEMFKDWKPGVDVMITIFGEKIGAFLKNQCYDQNFA
jgi:hypothetical protein